MATNIRNFMAIFQKIVAQGINILAIQPDIMIDLPIFTRRKKETVQILYEYETRYK